MPALMVMEMRMSAKGLTLQNAWHTLMHVLSQQVPSNDSFSFALY